jgi:thiosulfate reductase cytochrome b subunit
MDKLAGRKRRIRNLGRWCGYLALGLLLFTLLTGYGITEYRIVDPLTLGLLGKAIAQRLHPYTEVPMVIFLLVHISIALWGRREAERARKGAPYEKK